MKILDLVFEEKYITLKNGYNLVKNPSRLELLSRLKEWNNAARLMIAPKTNDVYFFNNFDYTHFHVSKELEYEGIYLNPKDKDINFHINYNSETNVFYVTDSTASNNDFRLFKSNPNINRIIKNDNVLYITNQDDFEEMLYNLPH